MSEPAIVLNVTNHERAVDASKNPSNASDRELRRAIRYYTEDRRESKRKAKKTKSLMDYHKDVGYDTGWDEITIKGYSSRVEKNNTAIRALQNELSRRRNRV